jgi:hypothetical protein
MCIDIPSNSVLEGKDLDRKRAERRLMKGVGFEPVRTVEQKA